MHVVKESDLRAEQIGELNLWCDPCYPGSIMMRTKINNSMAIV